MSGRAGALGRNAVVVLIGCAIALAIVAPNARGQQRREREPNSVYAARRAKLAAEVDAPIVMWGYTGREEFSEAAIFAQEENFYYLTGHNEEGAALIIWPSKSAGNDSGTDGKGEILFLP